MYKNVLGADVSDVMVSKVQIYVMECFCFRSMYFVCLVNILFFQDLPEHGVSTVFVNLGNSKLEVQLGQDIVSFNSV